ncbi:MAG: anaerobic sulfatase maturase [Planctomycetota bacterium]
MRPFSLLVKPTSADCNLRCAYCFYLDRAELYPESRKHRMSDEVLETMIRTFMQTDQPQYAIGWQGGEPTLMGVEFFRRVVELQKQYGRGGAVVANGLQTNATLIDDEFARHLAQYHFLVGCSLDGPAEIHNQYRKTIGGEGSHAAVWRGIEALRRHDAEFNILVLVSQANVHRSREVYRYLCDQGLYYHQYIPCVEFQSGFEPHPFAISGREWGEFLCEIFDEWVPNDTRRVSVRHFDSVLEYLVTDRTNVCVMGSDCRQYLVVEHNGDVYPCDFWVRDHYRLGNIRTDAWADLQASEVYRDFGVLKAQWNAACTDCPHLPLCRGDCLKHRLPKENDPRTLSWLCEGWKLFYDHTLDRFRALAQTVRTEQEAQRRAELARQQAAAAARRPGPTPGRRRPAAPPGRNDPCPCGSGKKYKKCCGR